MFLYACPWPGQLSSASNDELPQDTIGTDAKTDQEATDNILGPLPSPDIDKLLIAEPLPWAKKDETVEEKDRFPFTREEEATDDILGPLPFPDIDKFLIAEPLPWAKKDETVAVAVDEPINEDEDEEPYPDGPDNHQDETDDSIEEEKFNPRPPNLPLWARRLCEEEIQEGPEEGAIFLS
ncbi:unnamed protein product [Durusdinium trenchii]|uniref:Uncharacterized protein n=1 Tax=Durusdinium trenchii TaxID=1381693 RepID=A0ABP0MRG5_9DINO